MLGWIVILEIATPPWQLRPGLFRGRWNGRRTFRLWWLGLSLSAYRAEGLHAFFDHVERTHWVGSARPTPEEVDRG